MNRFLVTLVAVVCVGLMCTGIHPADAQTSPKMSGPTAVKNAYYVCAKCKVYYTEAGAKRAGYKDAMGHKLTKVAEIPKGYKFASPAKPGKMDPKSKM